MDAQCGFDDLVIETHLQNGLDVVRLRVLAERLAKALSDPFAPLGLNQPYEIEDAGDYTIPVHAEPRALPHVLVEVRNDLLASPEAITHIATLLATACTEPV